MLDEDIGRVPGEHVAHDTAADTRQHADEHEQEGAPVGIELQGVPDAHDREDAQAERVEQEHRRVEPALIVHQAVAQEGQEEQQSRPDRHEHVARIVKGQRRCDAEDQVAQDAAADGGDNGQNQNAQQIHFLFHCGQRAGRREGDRSGQLQHSDKVFHVRPPFFG